ncbi:MAG: precorrin-6A/cobalt-precorrin-6A reductase [Acidimicrobiia bacterium]|nr:precorrin-6A/cobalt-precorrin-6A reductase [Acidimicrobiia bacterium]
MSSAAPRLLVLAGTTEARRLVEQLAGAGNWEVIASFAGRTSAPAALPASVRVGGFGGTAGLERFLIGEGIRAVVDATHPFAAVMPHHVHAACASVGVPAIRLLRPGWEPVAGDHWVIAEDVADAARRLCGLGVQRVLLTTGRQELLPFAGLGSMHFVVRTIEPIDPGLFADAVTIRERGPFDLEGELALLGEHRIEAVVSKNSGGEATAAKLEAARMLGLPVVMVRRPMGPPARTVPGVADALRWLSGVAVGVAGL